MNNIQISKNITGIMQICRNTHFCSLENFHVQNKKSVSFSVDSQSNYSLQTTNWSIASILEFNQSKHWNISHINSVLRQLCLFHHYQWCTWWLHWTFCWVHWCPRDDCVCPVYHWSLSWCPLIHIAWSSFASY